MFDAILHPFAWAISWLWVWIHDFLVLVGMSSGSGIAWVLSIVLLTILVRIAIIPLFLKQIRSSRAMQAIQPEMRKIQEKYKGKKDQVSRQKMMEETQALQRKHKVSPFASCLPMLVQMPVLFGMYRAIIAVSSISAGTYTYRSEAADHLGPLTESVSTEIVNSTVFGVPLSRTLRESTGLHDVRDAADVHLLRCLLPDGRRHLHGDRLLLGPRPVVLDRQGHADPRLPGLRRPALLA